MPPTWLAALAWISLASAFVCAAAIVVRGYRQRVWIMDRVWPLTALYSGRSGGSPTAAGGVRPAPATGQHAFRSHYPFPVSVGISDTHCGAGCALGGVISEWVLFVTGATIAGVALWPEYIADFALAFAFGIAFQYFAIAPGAAHLYGIDEFPALRGDRGSGRFTQYLVGVTPFVLAYDRVVERGYA